MSRVVRWRSAQRLLGPVRNLRVTGTAVISGRVYDAAWDGPAGGGLQEVGWFVPINGQVLSGSAMTSVDGHYSLDAVPGATGAGQLWASRPSLADPTFAAWRTGLTWPDGVTTSFDFPEAQVPVDVQRGGPWDDWSRFEVVLDGVDGTSPLHAYGSIGSTQGSVHPLPGRYTGGAVYFWPSEGVEISKPMVVTPTGQTINGIDFVDAQHGWAVGGPGLNSYTRQDTIIVTRDGGVTWTKQTPESAIDSLVAVDFFDLQHGCAVVETGALISTSDGGQDWSVAQGFGGTSLKGVDMVGADNAWAVGWKGTPDYAGLVVHTTDGGVTWSPSVVDCSAALQDVEFTSLSKGWAVGLQGTIMRTTDGGETWVRQESGTTDSLTAITFSSSGHGCIVGDVSLVTTDGGETWVRGGSLNGARDVAFSDDEHGTAATATGVVTTGDGGLSWHRAGDASLQSAALSACSYAGSQHIWVGGTVGRLWLSGDGGSTWTSNGISVAELDAQRVGVVTPAGASTRPGGKVKLRLENVPAGWTVDLEGYPSYPTSAPARVLKSLVSTGRATQDLTVSVPSAAEPGYFYVLGLAHRAGSLYLETAVQLSALKASRTVVSRGGSVGFTGVVPTQGHAGKVAGKSKYVYLYKSTRSATQRFKLVKRYKANGYGRFTTGTDRPARTTWYVVAYPADSWYWEATTPVVKVTVR